MDSLLRRLAGSALDLLLPQNCAVCGREGRVVCPGCEAALPRLDRPYCSICAAPGPAQLCDWCATTPLAIDGIRAPYLMGGVVREMIFGLKYRNMRASAPELGRLLAAYKDTGQHHLSPKSGHPMSRNGAVLPNQVSPRTGL